MRFLFPGSHPHGSDETRIAKFQNNKRFIVLNPHGSDETIFLNFLKSSPWHRFLTHTVQMKPVVFCFMSYGDSVAVLNPHGSDETISSVNEIYTAEAYGVLNPHGSDETRTVNSYIRSSQLRS